MIDKQAADIDAVQTLRPAELILKYFRFIAVSPIEPVLRPEPHETHLILHNPGNPCLRQASVGRKLTKSKTGTFDNIDIHRKGIRMIV
jgi:hypothetical protein